MNKLKVFRLKINEIDSKIIDLICKRIKLVKEIKEYKKQKNITFLDKNREKEIYQRLRRLAKGKLNENFIKKLFKLIIWQTKNENKKFYQSFAK